MVGMGGSRPSSTTVLPLHNTTGQVPHTVKERLDDTLDAAQNAQKKYARNVFRAKWGLLIAACIQIVSNTLITGLSASTTNRHAQIGVAAMGAINTVVSSYALRIRGLGEPERSKTHADKLEQFVRKLRNFTRDDGRNRGDDLNRKILEYRTEFDELQAAAQQSENGQRKGERPAPTATPAIAKAIGEKV